MKQLQKDDLLYLAGFIDADGSIIAQFVYRKDYKFKFQIRTTLQITQHKKRRWILEEFQNLVGAGYIRTRGNICDFVVVEAINVTNLLKQLQPYHKLKKIQANLVLKILEQLPSTRDSLEKFLTLCPLVDQVAMLNDARKTTHTAETVTAMLMGLKEIDVPVETSDSSDV